MTANHVHHEHERSDLKTASLLKVVVALVVTVVIIAAGVWWMYGYVRKQDEGRDVRRTLIPPPSPLPAEPRLQVDPAEDFVKFKQEQDQVLNSYGWVSRETGRVRIPVERAMDLVAERGVRGQEKQ
jgi:hypothetical protein